LDELAPQHRGGKRRGVDRRLEPRPEIGDGAQVVLMGVGQHDADQIVAPLLDESGVRHHHLDAGHRIVGEADAEIDHQPFAGVAVQIEVHADLAGPAQGEEQELVVRRDGHALLRLKISIRPRAVMSGTICSITEVDPSNTGARPPVEITFIGLPNSALMRATMPSVRPTYPQNTPLCMQATVLVPITCLGFSTTMRGSCAVALTSASMLRLMP